MSSKQDPNYEKKIAEEEAKDENAEDMGKIVNIKGPAIKFPNETWEEIIMWIKRLELGQRVSLVNNRLFCISYPFMHEEKGHRLPYLRVYGDNNKTWMTIAYGNGSIKKVSKSEVPSVEIPDNIAAGSLIIWGIYNDVINFMRLLVPIYSTIYIDLDVKSEQELSKPKLKELMQLFEFKVQGLTIGEKITFLGFHKHHEFLLKDLVFIRICPEMTEQDFIALKNWLYQRREDNKPKVVKIWNIAYREFVEIIKEDFLKADQKFSFVIQFKYGQSDDEGLSCNIINSVTEQRLTIESFEYNDWIIARLSQDCSESPDEIYINTHASVQRLPNVYIDLRLSLNSK